MNSAVWFATLNKFHAIGDFLIRNGVNVTRPIGRSSTLDNRATLIHIAAKSGKLHRVKLLLENGADLNAKDSWKRSVLHYTVDSDKAAVADYLITAGADINARDKNSISVLHHAVMKGAQNAIRVLLQRGVEIDAVDTRGWNALHLAIMTRNISIIEMLLKHGSSVNIRDVLTWTPLHFATFYTRNEQIVRMLLDHGAEIDAKSEDGRFPLYYAAMKKTPLIVKLLLSRGAKINETTEELETALHAACQESVASIANMLLHNGADVNITNTEGQVALSTAKTENGQTTAKTVIKHISRMEVANAFVNEENLNEIRNNNELHEFYNKCHEELEVMKNMVITEDCRASYFSILSQDLKTNAALLRNHELVQAFQKNQCWKKFPIYAEDLKYKFILAKDKTNALVTMEEYLSDAVDYRLPEILVQKIASYLDNKNFVNFVALSKFTQNREHIIF
ncbi:hypothetical protein TSAR_011559 [Trichomalopsis sarcophagae]|uniref:Uncharacterized protein n=1 Tax=Trichomalopsis sarcophagae TaxID=543379 RepID=A0A232EQJ2_9HYME|nr:hypothetical protein TSAR_011559 [Trichomalopsis sarcophagae]